MLSVNKKSAKIKWFYDFLLAIGSSLCGLRFKSEGKAVKINIPPNSFRMTVRFNVFNNQVPIKDPGMAHVIKNRTNGRGTVR